MTKFLGERDVGERLEMMGMRKVPGNRIGKPRADETEGGKLERGKEIRSVSRRRWADLEADEEEGMDEVLGLWRLREGGKDCLEGGNLGKQGGEAACDSGRHRSLMVTNTSVSRSGVFVHGLRHCGGRYGALQSGFRGAGDGRAGGRIGEAAHMDTHYEQRFAHPRDGRAGGRVGEVARKDTHCEQRFAPHLLRGGRNGDAASPTGLVDLSDSRPIVRTKRSGNC